MNYYNEWDKSAAAWLRELIKAGLIPPGDVDERSITEVKAHELTGYTQHHFFAGIGGWSLALQLAGWPRERPVVTGSPPCQPFSVGLNDHAKGRADDRHLLPAYLGLVVALNPETVFGEQVANAIKWGWLDELCDSLENENYSVWSLVLPASAMSADHERKRIFWCAHAKREGRKGHQPVGGVFGGKGKAQPIPCDAFADARRAMDGDFSHLLPCDGLSVQLERDALKGFGNAIVPQVAAAFIQAAEAARYDLGRVSMVGRWEDSP